MSGLEIAGAAVAAIVLLGLGGIALVQRFATKRGAAEERAEHLSDHERDRKKADEHLAAPAPTGNRLLDRMRRARERSAARTRSD